MNVKEIIYHTAYSCQYKPFFFYFFWNLVLYVQSLSFPLKVLPESTVCVCSDCVAITTWQSGCCSICHGVKKKKKLLETHKLNIFLYRARRSSIFKLKKQKTKKHLIYFCSAVVVRADMVCCSLVTVRGLQATCYTTLNAPACWDFTKHGVQKQ